MNEKYDNIGESGLNFYENITAMMEVVLSASDIFESSNIEERNHILEIVFQNLKLRDENYC